MGRKSKPLELIVTDRKDLRTYLSIGKRSALALKRAIMLKYMDEKMPTEHIIS